MALLTEKILFIHRPRTGGTWIRQAITAPRTECGHFHSNLNDEEVVAMLSRRFSFSFVRNPVTWYPSRWSSPHHRARVKDGSRLAPQDIQNKEEEHDFGAWLTRMLRDFPHHYTFTCKHFFGKDYTTLDFVGKYENLAGDLITALTAAGEKFNQTAILTLPKINASVPEFHSRAIYTGPLLEQLIDQEQEIMKHFDYQTDPAVYFEPDAKMFTRPVRPKLL